MPRTSTFVGIVQNWVDQAGHSVSVTFQGSFSGFNQATDGPYLGFEWGIGAFNNQGPVYWTTGLFGYPDCPPWFVGNGGVYTYEPGFPAAFLVLKPRLQADQNYQVRARLDDFTYSNGTCTNFFGRWTSTPYYFKTYAITATTSVPTSSGITSVQATIQCNYFPNTQVSTASVKLQYKRTVDSIWIDAGAADVTSGYSQQTITRTITGLLAATQYDVRLTMTRTTVNETTLTSATHQFSTTGAAPTVVTNNATNISVAGTTLNGTVNPNGVSTTYWFDYGLTTAYGTSTAVQGPSSGGSPIPFSAVTGVLLPDSVYHFRAHALQGGTDYYGADLQFSTSTEGHIMPSVYQNFAKYGVQQDFFFCVEVPGTSGSDRFLSAAVPWIAGDVKVDKDGGGLNNVTNLPVRIGTTPLYKWTGTAGELSGSRVNVLLVDQDGPAWRDLHLAIETKLLLGQLDVDATAIGGNVHAMSLVGVGAGYGLFAKGSSGLYAAAQGTSGFGIVGVAVGAGYGLAGAHPSGSVGVTNLFDQLEGTEPSGAPVNNDSFRHILQYAKRRDVNKVTQDSSHQIWYRDNSTDMLCQRTVSDDLVTQVQNKLF